MVGRHHRFGVAYTPSGAVEYQSPDSLESQSGFREGLVSSFLPICQFGCFRGSDSVVKGKLSIGVSLRPVFHLGGVPLRPARNGNGRGRIGRDHDLGHASGARSICHAQLRGELALIAIVHGSQSSDEFGALGSGCGL